MAPSFPNSSTPFPLHTAQEGGEHRLPSAPSISSLLLLPPRAAQWYCAPCSALRLQGNSLLYHEPLLGCRELLLCSWSIFCPPSTLALGSAGLSPSHICCAALFTISYVSTEVHCRRAPIWPVVVPFNNWPELALSSTRVPLPVPVLPKLCHINQIYTIKSICHIWAKKYNLSDGLQLLFVNSPSAVATNKLWATLDIVEQTCKAGQDPKLPSPCSRKNRQL